MWCLVAAAVIVGSAIEIDDDDEFTVEDLGIQIGELLNETAKVRLKLQKTSPRTRTHTPVRQRGLFNRSSRAKYKLTELLLGLGAPKVIFCIGLYAAAFSSAITVPLAAALAAEQMFCAIGAENSAFLGLNALANSTARVFVSAAACFVMCLHCWACITYFGVPDRAVEGRNDKLRPPLEGD
eukprot:SAG11_NODE_6289_length_1344_cov_0.749398_2_plen_182_part_00